MRACKTNGKNLNLTLSQTLDLDQGPNHTKVITINILKVEVKNTQDFREDLYKLKKENMEILHTEGIVMKEILVIITEDSIEIISIITITDSTIEVTEIMVEVVITMSRKSLINITEEGDNREANRTMLRTTMMVNLTKTMAITNINNKANEIMTTETDKTTIIIIIIITETMEIKIIIIKEETIEFLLNYYKILD